MNINEFVEKFGEQLDDTDVSTLTPETKFRDLNEWRSLIALSIIAMVDEEYEVTLKGADIQESQTIKDIFDKVVAKKV